MNYSYFKVSGEPDTIVRGDENNMLDWQIFNRIKKEWVTDNPVWWFDTCCVQAIGGVDEISEAEAAALTA